MLLEKDLVVTALVEEFRQMSAELPGVGPEALDFAVQELCEVSRDILLSLGPPENSDKEFLDDIAEMFRACALAVEDLSPMDSKPREFAANIRDRANDIGVK